MIDYSEAVRSVGAYIYTGGGEREGTAVGDTPGSCPGCGAEDNCLRVSIGSRSIVGCPTCCNNIVAGLKMMIGWHLANKRYTLGYPPPAAGEDDKEPAPDNAPEARESDCEGC